MSKLTESKTYNKLHSLLIRLQMWNWEILSITADTRQQRKKWGDWNTAEFKPSVIHIEAKTTCEIFHHPPLSTHRPHPKKKKEGRRKYPTSDGYSQVADGTMYQYHVIVVFLTFSPVLHFFLIVPRSNIPFFFNCCYFCQIFILYNSWKIFPLLSL